jgi:hypothetical protein
LSRAPEIAVVPCAAQRETVRRRHGTSFGLRARGSGSAQHHFVLQRARNDRHDGLGGTVHASASYLRGIATTEIFMRGILLWLIGIPIPIIILLYLFHVV